MYNSELVNAVIKRREEQHKHLDYIVDIDLGSGKLLKYFHVEKGVARPEVTSSILLAKWLALENLENIPVIEIGCGTGIQSIVAAKYCNAKYVAASDISLKAKNNTDRNVRKYDLSSKITVLESDFFSRIPDGEGLVLFNHPFFANEANPLDEMSKSWCGGKQLIHRFFQQATKFCGTYGIIMPYWTEAGEWNDPSIQCTKYGLKVKSATKLNENLDMPGNFNIYHLIKT